MRTAGFYHWNDQQNLDQAIMIAKKHPIRFNEVERWSEKESETKKFKIFLNRLAELDKK